MKFQEPHLELLRRVRERIAAGSDYTIGREIQIAAGEHWPRLDRACEELSEAIERRLDAGCPVAHWLILTGGAQTRESLRLSRQAWIDYLISEVRGWN